MNRFFRIGTVAEAIKNNLFCEKFVISLELKSILKIRYEMYINKRSPLEILESLKSTVKSTDDILENLKSS